MKFPSWLNLAGDPTYRGDCPKESAELTTFISKMRREFPDIPVLHIKNEGKRTAIQATVDKAQGLTAGAPDIVILGSPSFVCEIKRKDHTKSTWQPKQIEFLEQSMKLGAYVCVALGYEAAFNEVLKYLSSLKK